MLEANCDIAIVGLGLHFPGADNTEQYWECLQKAQDLSRPMSGERRKISLSDLIDPETKADKMRSERGYFLDSVPSPKLFNLPEGTDPVFTLPLSAAKQALSEVKIIPKERTGMVMAAIALPTDTTSALTEEMLGQDLLARIQNRLPERLKGRLSEFSKKSGKEASGLNITPAGLPAQLTAAYFNLGLGAYTLDAACASSLVAVELACRELRSGRADAMLAGGLSRPDCLYTQMGFSALHALSPTGKCSPFDKKANGLMVGEGCGLTVLKRLKDAVRDGDSIYAVIKGTGLSNDIEGSLVAPASEGQIRCLKDAYKICGLNPWDIDLIECHGTGTPVGDKIEFSSLQKLWEEAPKDTYCSLRSVKSMTGHLLTAAGAAGLIRVLLNLKHGLITPQVNFSEPGIDLQNSHFKISSKAEKWISKDGSLRRAAVSGFGFGGINAHMILEEYRQGASVSSYKENTEAEDSAAIIGMSCHIGRIQSLKDLAECILNGESALEAPPEDRIQKLSEVKDHKDKSAYISETEVPIGRFRIPPADLPSILPQQSLFLNTAAEAMLDAGQPLRMKRERAAAFTGINLDLNSTNFNLRWLLKDKASEWAKQLNLDEKETELWKQALQNEVSEPLDAVKTIGALGSIAASRAAREFQFGACSFTVSSQELSGFDALRIAADALLSRRLDLALVGTVDLQGDVRVINSRNNTEAPNSSFGEGACCLILKRLSDAERDGDHVYAVVKGLSKAGQSQNEAPEAALEKALNGAVQEAAAAAEKISALELAGTNYIKDGPAPMASALRNALDKGSVPLVCSSFTDIAGHCGASSMLASIIKTALCLDQEILAGSAAFEKPCTLSESWQNSRFAVMQSPSYWYRNRADGARTAAVCAQSYPNQFASVILEEAPHKDFRPLARPKAKAALWPFFGSTAEEILSSLADLQNKTSALSGDSAAKETFKDKLYGLCLENYKNQKDKAHKKLCLAFASDLESENLQNEFKGQLETALEHLSTNPQNALQIKSIYYTPDPLAEKGNIAFVYPGSGANFLGLGREFALNFSELMHKFDTENLYTAGEFAVYANQPYRLFWNEGWKKEALQNLSSDTHKMMSSQVGFGMLTTDIVRSLRITPSAAIGYSLGESSALFSLKAWPERDKMYLRMEGSDLFRKQLSGPCLSARRAWNIPEDKEFVWTAAVLPKPAEEVKKVISSVKDARLLIINTDKECVVGGTEQAVDELCSLLKTRAIKVKGVDTVHCDCLEPVSKEYWQMHHLPCVPPEGIDFYSGNKNCSYKLTSESIADSIVSHGVYGFDYTKTIRQAWNDGIRIFLEMGPGASCARMIQNILKDKPHFAASLSVSGKSEMLSLSAFAAGILSQGLRPALDAFFVQKTEAAPKRSVKIPLGRKPYNPHVPAVSEKIESDSKNMQEYKENSAAVQTSAPKAEEQIQVPVQQIISAAPIQKAETAVSSQTASDPLLSLFVNMSQTSSQAHLKWLEFASESASYLGNLISSQSALIAQAKALGFDKAVSLSAAVPDNQTIQPPKETRQIKPHGYKHKLHGVETTTDGGYICGDKPSLAPKDQKVFLDRSECLEFAVGKIGDVLGERFAPIDSYAARVRLPAEPLMLVDRIVSIEGDPLSLGSGRIVTEHDVIPGMWYLDGNRAPVFISVEAGQADLFLCSWLGIDFKAKGKRVYRLLDANVKFHRGLPQPGETMRYDIRIKRFINQGDTWLFFFEYEGTIDGKTFLTMRDGCAGFFTHEEIRNNGGLVMTEESLKPKKGKKGPEVKDLVPLKAASYTLEQVEALRSGDLEGCFGSSFAGLNLKHPISIPSGLLRLIHRIPECDPYGGRWGLGKVVAESDVHPEDWYLTCHFVDDMVMPGTLMYECCAHALRFMLTSFGWVGEQDEIAYEPVLGVKAVLKCRGPVLQTTKTVRYQVEIKEIGYNPAPYVIADAIMFADNKRVVGFENVSMQLTGTTGEKLEKLWAERKAPAHSKTETKTISLACTNDFGDPRAQDPGNLENADGRLGLIPASKNVRMQGDALKAAIFDEEQFRQFAVGTPSLAFGDEFKEFDSRFIARLPGIPYQFVNRIVSSDHPFLQTKAGGWVEAQYDIPANAWYFKANKTGTMPFCVINEIALQVCGWVSSYAGSSRQSDQPLHYRNLGGTSKLYREITPDTGRVTIRVRMTKSSEAGGLIIQAFDMQLGQNDQIIYEGSTTFGFFTEKALADQVGVRGCQNRLWMPSAEDIGIDLPIAQSRPLSPYDGTAEQTHTLELPSKALLMLDEVKWYPQGGKRKLGAAIGRKKIDVNEWFFTAHFYQDPVMPGSLGLEAFIQVLKAAALKLWPNLADTHHFAAITGQSAHTWLYRGQVIRANKFTVLRVEITEINDGPEPSLKADGFLQADDLTIYELKDFGMTLLKN